MAGGGPTAAIRDRSSADANITIKHNILCIISKDIEVSNIDTFILQSGGAAL